ncbi:FadR/GntR family transcriptional regulator [Planomonospora venezuelensis]|uniref:GntR family transcriptional repressor for pyruvate dehydrogenase complex n=1 Tax=Planomonospora venezuelensis TaxID=1999 RepID=A0A841DDZ3_PLAVE|nr:FCD domain-containing protein [Planomonospora venezuelensis]MBB5967107.1 GntR family transcriptional repressor for pyruvate dehydrogenase complex [Planomonospora venezuelensis]GIN04947.1 GntR family transcriptional regulator [Planomonospora venezuelensis]
MEWQPVRKTRTFEEVLAQIERRIAEDGLTAGDRLPGERQLAGQLHVSRASVREALRVLETLGVVSSQAGRGPDAGAVLISRPESALADLLRLHLGTASLSLDEVIDTRLMIEQWAVLHAHPGHAPAALDAMAAALERMEAAATPQEFVDHDVAFHLGVAMLSGNRLLAATMRALRQTIHAFSVAAVERAGQTGLLMADHRRIHELVAAGDGPAAARAVTEHLARAYPPAPDGPPEA